MQKLILVLPDDPAYLRDMRGGIGPLSTDREDTMAAFDTNRPIATASAGGLLSIIGSAFAAVEAWMDARETRRQLKRLNTHQLDDIGMISADIDLFVAKYR